jgi:hypothetical protein
MLLLHSLALANSGYLGEGMHLHTYARMLLSLRCRFGIQSRALHIPGPSMDLEPSNQLLPDNLIIGSINCDHHLLHVPVTSRPPGFSVLGEVRAGWHWSLVKLVGKKFHLHVGYTD